MTSRDLCPFELLGVRPGTPPAGLKAAWESRTSALDPNDPGYKMQMDSLSWALDVLIHPRGHEHHAYFHAPGRRHCQETRDLVATTYGSLRAPSSSAVPVARKVPQTNARWRWVLQLLAAVALTLVPLWEAPSILSTAKMGDPQLAAVWFAAAGWIMMALGWWRHGLSMTTRQDIPTPRPAGYLGVTCLVFLAFSTFALLVPAS